MYKICYEKKFLAGALEGLEIPCHFNVSMENAAAYVQSLERCTVATPGRDVYTQAPYAVSNIRVEA